MRRTRSEREVLDRHVIRNAVAYPLSQKKAVLATWAHTERSASTIAAEYNISVSTVHRWSSEAGLQRPMHPNTAAANASRSAERRAAKAYNTPMVNPDGSIVFQGRTYR